MIGLARIVAGVGLVVALAGCEGLVEERIKFPTDRAEVMTATSTGLALQFLPPPEQPIDLGVYVFPDLTGQNEPEEDFAELSRAVTQGGADLLTDVLATAGGGSWFNIVERARVDNLLRERSIIEQTQAAFTGGVSLPPLRFAGTLVEGSIVGYDTNLITGGTGARYLGVGVFTEYRRDIVTIALRAVSVSTGRVLTSVTTTKTIYSVRTQGDVFRFVAVDEILEVESGYSRNEPEIFAVREAMELAVLAMIVEGAVEGHWSFADHAAGARVIENYRRRYELARLGYSPADIEAIYAREAVPVGMVAERD